MAPLQVRVFPIHVVIDRSVEIPGRWNAHCLEFDVMSWADTIPKALAMVREAIEQTVVDDLGHGWDPMRRSAPQEDWDRLLERMRKAQVEQAPESEATEPEFVIVEMTMRVVHATPDRPAVTPEFTAPVSLVPAVARVG